VLVLATPEWPPQVWWPLLLQGFVNAPMAQLAALERDAAGFERARVTPVLTEVFTGPRVVLIGRAPGCCVYILLLSGSSDLLDATSFNLRLSFPRK
jgi:hypothetical protein